MEKKIEENSRNELHVSSLLHKKSQEGKTFTGEKLSKYTAWHVRVCYTV